MEILVSVEQKPYYAVFAITLTSRLRYRRHRVLFEGMNIFGLCRHQGMVAAVSGHSELAGTVTLLLDLPPNQPHRGEIAKMMTRVRYRGRGVARALMVELERIAIERGRTMLTLDTASDEGASGLYEKLGFVYAGTLPEYALKPHGGLTGTMLYWKRIGA